MILFQTSLGESLLCESREAKQVGKIVSINTDSGFLQRLEGASLVLLGSQTISVLLVS